MTDLINGCRTTKIYCRPGCPAGKRTKRENRVHFSSINEARVEGYRPCKVCKPDDLLRPLETLSFTRYRSPLGLYLIVTSIKGVFCVKTEKQSPALLKRWEKNGLELKKDAEHHNEITEQFDAYFTGKPFEFDLPLDLRGTPFQLQVWALLQEVPWGHTRTYGQIADALGRPKASRAVGRAVGTNPVSIVVPCHRIIGTDGSLTGYGGGLDRKAALLKREGLELG